MTAPPDRETPESRHSGRLADPAVADLTPPDDRSAPFETSTFEEISEERNPVDRIAEQFAERIRRGEHPRIETYLNAHPDLADELEVVLPAVALIESSKRSALQQLLPADRDGHDGPTGHGKPIAMPRRLGDYWILGEVGRGGMGVVYEAEQESLGRRVAIKVLPANSLPDRRQVERFLREAKAAARLHLTNIVTVFDIGQQDDLHYYVMQFIRGRALDQVLDDLRHHRPIRFPNHPETPEAFRIPEDSPSPAPTTTRDADTGDLDETVDFDHGLAVQPRVPATSEQRPEVPVSPFTVSSVDVPEPAESLPPSPSDGSRSRVLTLLEASQTLDLSQIQPQTPEYFRAVAAIGVQVADALDYAHSQGTLHRDIKPGNLILDRQGAVWITDFGLAKLREQDNLTGTGDVIGTLRYMAPEQLHSRAEPRSEIYSLGLTLYELLTLRPAFDAREHNQLLQQIAEATPPRPRQLVPHLPRDLETVVLMAIAPEPQRRYALARDLAEDLQRFLDDRPVRARRITPPERLWRWCRRNPIVAGLTGLAASLLLAVAGIYMVATIKLMNARDLQQAEYQRAEANVDLALESFKRLLSELQIVRPGASLEEGHDLPVRQLDDRDQAILSIMLEFYEQFAQENQGTTAEFKIALASQRIAEIKQRMNMVSSSIEWYEKALEYYLKAKVPVADRLKVRLQRAECYRNIGVQERARGLVSMARERFEQALDELRDGCRDAPNSTEIHCAYAETLNDDASLLWRLGEFPEARTRLNEALTELERIAPDQQRLPHIRFVRAMALGHLARTYLDDPEAQDEAERYRDASLAILRQLAPNTQVGTPIDPTLPPSSDPDVQSALASILSLEIPSRDQRRRQRMLLEAESITKQLVADYSSVTDYRSLLGRIHRQQGDLALDRAVRAASALPSTTSESDPSGSNPRNYFNHALTLHQRALRTARELAEGDSVVHIFDLDVADALNSLAETEEALGHLEEARNHYVEAKRELVDFLEQFELNLYGWRLQIETLEGIARTSEALGQLDKARAARAQAERLSIPRAIASKVRATD